MKEEYSMKDLQNEAGRWLRQPLADFAFLEETR